MRQVQTFYDLKKVQCAGPFLYAVIQEGTPDSKIFGHPNWLALLAHATLRQHVAVTGKEFQPVFPTIFKVL